MPPKRKRAAVPPPQPSPPPEEPVASEDEAAAAEEQDPDTTTNSRGSDDHDTTNPPPTLFNTTFALYRASPLYLGPERLTKPRLRTLSQRLRDTLVGDVVRGVQSVEWRWVPVRKLLPRRRRGDSSGSRGAKRRRKRQRDGSAELGSRNEGSGEEEENGSDDEDEDRNADARALSVELRYENSTFAACLLPRLYKNDNDDDDAENVAASQWTTTSRSINGNGKTKALVADPKQFLHLPLLLLRMPAPLRTVINDFLARTFDVRVRPLRLGTRTLVSSWAAWHADSGIDNNNNDGGGGGRRLFKDVVLSLGFHVVEESSPPSSLTKEQQQQGQGKLQTTESTKNGGGGDMKKNNNTGDTSTTATAKSLGLKSIDIIVPAADVRRFLRAGQQAIQARDDDETSGPSKRKKGKRKAGEPSPPPSHGDKSMMLSPSRRRTLAGGKDDEGWAWRSAEAEAAKKEPFTEALAGYLDRHLALDMFHPGVRILRVACEGFVLSEGGRLKVFVPPAEDGSTKSAWKFLDGLVERARGRDWGSVPAIPGLE
ncbi:kinetochore complex Sim4 subunit Fta1-domain-containing protein [Apiospora arundinis]